MIQRLSGITLAALIAVSVPAFAQQEPAKKGGGPEARHEQMIQKLGLSAEQAEALRKVREQSRQESRALYQQLHQKRQALQQYLTAPDATQAEAQRLQQEINDLQGRLSELRIKGWFAMRQHLTPEQVRKMSEMRGKGMMPPRRGPKR